MTTATATLPRARIVLAALTACGLAALAWAAFVQPSARIVYNPSDSVPVGWYRIDSADSLPRPLSVGSIVLTTLPADAAALAAQRGYLPSHIPLLKRVGAVAPQHVCIVNGIVRIDGHDIRQLDPSWLHAQPVAAIAISHRTACALADAF